MLLRNLRKAISHHLITSTSNNERFLVWVPSLQRLSRDSRGHFSSIHLTWESWPWLVNVIGLLILFTLLNWNSLNAPFETDEGEYAYSAWLMKTGHMPYRDSFLQKPPMIVYTYLLAQIINKDPLWPPHLLGILFLAISTGLLGVIAMREFGSAVGWISMWVFLPMMGLPLLAPFASNTEKFMVLPMLGMIAIYAFNRTSRSVAPWFWSGLLFAIAMYYKPIVLFPSIFMYAFWAFETWRSDRKLLAVLPRFLYAALGIAFASAAVFGYFIYKGVLFDFWESAVTFNTQMIEVFNKNLESFSFHMKGFLHAWFVPLFFVPWIFTRKPQRQWFYAGLLLIGIFSIRHAHAGHYYIMVLPILSLLCAAGIQTCTDKIALWWSPKRGVLVIAVTCIVVVSECWPLRHQVFQTPRELVANVYSGYAFIESETVARRVEQLCQPEERVFIAGSEPQILYYAKRLSPTRFVTMFPLMFPTPSAVKYQEIVVSDLQRNPPALIVLAQYSWSWWRSPQSPTQILSYLGSLLNREYTLIGGYVRTGDWGEWREPLTVEQQQQCSLVLFKRNNVPR